MDVPGTGKLSYIGRIFKMSSKRKKVFAITLIIAALGGIALACWLIGKPMVEFFSHPETLREWVKETGIWSRLAFVAMMALQVILAFIPGEPLEIGAGYGFGAIEGTILCLLGALIGSVTVFLLVKRWGIKLVTIFISEEKLNSLKFLKNTRRLHTIAYILFLIPGTPKDVMTYFAGLTPMRLGFWIFITLTARIPSVITSTVGGDALGMQNYTFAIWVFVVTSIISVAGLIAYRCILEKHSGDKPEATIVPAEKHEPAA